MVEHPVLFIWIFLPSATASFTERTFSENWLLHVPLGAEYVRLSRHNLFWSGAGHACTNQEVFSGMAVSGWITVPPSTELQLAFILGGGAKAIVELKVCLKITAS